MCSILTESQIVCINVWIHRTISAVCMALYIFIFGSHLTNTKSLMIFTYIHNTYMNSSKKDTKYHPSLFAKNNPLLYLYPFTPLKTAPNRKKRITTSTITKQKNMLNSMNKIVCNQDLLSPTSLIVYRYTIQQKTPFTLR